MKQRLCPQCGLRNPSDAPECSGCVTRLSEADEVDNESVEQPDANRESEDVAADPEFANGNRFCECDYPSRARSDFCTQCGDPFAATSTADSTAKASAGSDPAADRTGSGGNREEDDTADDPETRRKALTLRFGARETLRFENTLLLGRGYYGLSPNLAKWLALHPGVSRRHCMLLTQAEGLAIVDLGSANGTWVNNERLRAGTPCLLLAGTASTVISLGCHARVTIAYEDDPA